ncbi:GPP34 family phosphoprotein [Saccharopolyspora sp. 6M]|uniref:GOLPH3/VPS74 family protein n=1 Tax=Saccharopolyspora sp. 6M TaxID=2877237 RepID=UPI002729F99C|nr:GPP34 family phosphoprotein [Saccharopolyspora sp. 6M]
MNVDPEPSPSVTLPGELVLLLHRPDGGHRAGPADLLTWCAELGELALRGKVELTGTKLAVLDPCGTGLDWADELLGRLVKKSGPRGRPVELTDLLPRRIGRFREHRALLERRGMLLREPRKLLGFIPDDLHFPVGPARRELVEQVRAVARGELRADGRRAVRCGLVHAAGIGAALGGGPAELAVRAAVARGAGAGGGGGGPPGAGGAGGAGGGAPPPRGGGAAGRAGPAGAAAAGAGAGGV